MPHISTDTASRLFGMIDGIRFWIQWRISIKIELFYYKHIAHKKWCSWNDYSCSDKACTYPHFDEPSFIIVE